MIPGRKEAFVTLATNDTYSLGCLVLGYSLRRVNTSKKLVVMVSTDVSNPMRTQLAQVFDVIQEVNVLDSNDPINLSLLGRPDLNVTFTKLHCWRLTDFEKAVFLDADTLVLQNVDELLDREELSAAPDAGWPDCFNSGVFVFRPSIETYEKLLAFATSHGSFDGGDQGLLNMFFKNWAHEDISKHLPFIYNVVSQAFYSYLPAFTKFKDTVKIVHFIGAVKPWHHSYDIKSRTVHVLPGTGHSQEFLQFWWNVFMEYVQPNLDPALRLIPLCPPSEPEECVDNHCHINNGEPEQKPRLVEETIHAVFPFKPPDVEKVFYEVDKSSPLNSDSEMDTSREETVVEITVIPRTYSELESHYVEEPISHINPSDPPPGTYSATWITEGWEKGTKGPGPDPPDYTVTNKSNESENTNNEHETAKSESESKEIEISISNPANETSHVEDEPSKVSDETSSPVGLVGELASMSIGGEAGPAPFVPDAVRKFNWERGQIDYLGQDSFENIQRKIDETLNAEAPQAMPTMGSPFVPKSTAVAERPEMPVAQPPPKSVVPAAESKPAAPAEPPKKI